MRGKSDAVRTSGLTIEPSPLYRLALDLEIGFPIEVFPNDTGIEAAPIKVLVGVDEAIN